MRLPRKLKNFDYLIPEKLKEKIKLGQIVEIPFRNSQKNGIIFSIHDDEPCANLKNILRIIERNPIINDAQIKLLSWASFYYCSSPAAFLNAIIPEIPALKKFARKIYSDECNLPKKKLKILKSEIPKIQKILKKILENKKILLQWNNYYNKTAIYIKLLEKFSADKQVILIFPQFSDLKKFLYFLPENLKVNTSILRSDLPKKKHFLEWETIKNKKNGIIIGTRQAIFAPLENLGLIIIDNEENISHKQWEQNPRYHTLKISKKLQKITDAKIIIASNIPSAETYYISKKEKYKIILEDDGDDFRIKNNIKIIQMQDEWNKKNYSILSEDAIDLIKKNINLNKNSLIYINRRGASQLVICKDCGYIPLCPKCNLALTLHSGKENILKCHHCNFTKMQITPCPKCNGFNMKFAGTGTEKAEKILKEIFKDTRIIRVDTDNKKRGIRDDLLCTGETKIIIATNAILSYISPINIASCIFLNIDTNLNIPSFRAFENTAQIIKNLSLLIEPEGELIIQSYGNIKENLPFLKENYGFTKYYNRIIEERRNINYPPFSQLIKLTFKNKDVKITKFATDKLFNILNKELGIKKNISLLEPITLPAQRNNYINEIIIKNKGDADDLQKWLTANVPQEWIIDIDPIEI